MTQPAAHVLILGAGFAALAAIRELRRRAPDLRIALLAPRPEFVFLPSLIWVPTGLRAADELVYPLAPFLVRHRVNFIPGRVAAVRESGRLVLTEDGEIRNDALLIATGGRFLRTLPGIEHALTLCQGVDAALAIRERLGRIRSGRIAMGFGSNPKEPGAMRGGPMFELLFGVDTWLRRQHLRRHVALSFFSPAQRPGARLGEKAVDGLLAEMARRDITTHLGARPMAFSPRGVQTEHGAIDADLTLFMPGMTGPEWLVGSDLPTSPGGFVAADAQCQVLGTDRTFVAGDAGSYPGPDWLPKQAHMAELQARAAAENLLLALDGHAARVRPRPELMCIIDSLDGGTLVYRSEKRGMVVPGGIALHWAKRAFEGLYTRRLA